MILNTIIPIENTLHVFKSRFLLVYLENNYSGDIYIFLFYIVILLTNLYFLLFDIIMSFGSKYINYLLNLTNSINYYMILLI